MQRAINVILIAICVLALPVFGATVGSEATGGHSPLWPIAIVGGLAGAYLAMKAAMSDTTMLGPTPSVGAADYQAIVSRDYHTLDWANGTGTDVSGGDVVVVGTVPMVAIGYIANGKSGTLVYLTTVKAKKTSAAAFSQGDAVYWNTAGNPLVGSAGTGACTDNASESGTTYPMGFAITAAAAVSADRVEVTLTASRRTATVAGAVTATDITGSDSSLGIGGAPASQGGAIVVTGGTSSTSANAGGAVSVIGGAPGLTGAGGAVAVAGGAGGATSGTGGAASLRGGAGTGTSASGGAVTVAGGAGVSTAGVGGAVAITGGASPGASGTAGGVTVDAGAATGGTGASVNFGTTNASAVNIGLASVPTNILGPQTRGVGASTAALGTTYASAAGLPAGTASIYPVTAADDAVGVIIDAADKVTGRTLFIGNLVSNKILKVYGPSGASINGAGANVGFSSVSGKGVIITCLSGASNTWMAW